MLAIMAGKRGVQHRGRSDVFQPGKPVRAQVPLAAGDPVRKQYEELVSRKKISGAEVLREAIKCLHRHEFGRQLKEAG
ncbi:hypothetical protein SAMN05428942_7271 [Streptomyces sp. 2112.2]|nr:hypothetical protein SAMN05428942_7271 [Streptomyces sp. 2112.2]